MPCDSLTKTFLTASAKSARLALPSSTCCAVTEGGASGVTPSGSGQSIDAWARGVAPVGKEAGDHDQTDHDKQECPGFPRSGSHHETLLDEKR